ncbi:hypothetical protein Plec18170_005600 [Paecilomyces lecythidis]
MMWRSTSSCGSLTRSQINFLVSYFIVFLFAVLYARRHFYRDPGSIFFDPVEGYRPIYSLERVERAKAFIKQISTEQITPPRKNTQHEKNMCIGIATVKRPGDQPIDMTLASILADLTLAEREEIHLALLFAHEPVTNHPFFDVPWVRAVTDRVMTYKDLGHKPTSLNGANKEHRIAKKTLQDYSLLLRSCLNQTDAPWITILEDDVLAQEGWYPRTMRNLHRLQHKLETKEIKQWLYLRLFYTEKFMGWNSEDWPRYLCWSLVLVSLPAVCGFHIRRRFPSARNSLSLEFLFLISFLCVPMAIALYFLSGHVSMQPLRPGLCRMNEFGCCSQALVFPRDMVPSLIDHLDEKHTSPGPVDSVIEEWADENNLDRWSLVPSAMQHIGKKTYKKNEDSQPRDKFEVSGARGLWSFGFELHGNRRGHWWDNDFDLIVTG